MDSADTFEEELLRVSRMVVRYRSMSYIIFVICHGRRTDSVKGDSFK